MSAVISPCGQYRYSLSRSWAIGLPWITWVMLNPSTADAEKDDPTIRRCIGFSKQWGYGALYVVNLFAFRATDPKDLRRAIKPVGPENDEHILQAACNCKEIIAAWGAHGRYQNRDSKVMELLRGFPISSLGVTAQGFPKHPLYIPGEMQRVIFQEAVAGEPQPGGEGAA